MSISFQQTPYKQRVTILNDSKYSLVGDPVEGNPPGKSPRLFFEIYNNYPRLLVRMNNGKKAKEGGQYEYPIDLVAFMSIVVALEDATRSQGPITQFIAVKKTGFDRETRKRTEPYVAALIVVGKDQDGCEFIGIQNGKPNGKNYFTLKFRFTPPEFHPIVDANTGELVDRPRLSNIMARAWIKLLTSLLPQINAHVWDYATTAEGKWAIERVAKEGNGNGGYNNNNYNQNNSYQNKPANNNGGGFNSFDAPPKPVQQTQPTPETSEVNFDEDVPW